MRRLTLLVLTFAVATLTACDFTLITGADRPVCPLVMVDSVTMVTDSAVVTATLWLPEC